MFLLLYRYSFCTRGFLDHLARKNQPWFSIAFWHEGNGLQVWSQHLSCVPVFIMRYGGKSTCYALGSFWSQTHFLPICFRLFSIICQALEYHWVQLLSKKELELEVARVHTGDCVIMWKTFGLNSLDQWTFFSKYEYQKSWALQQWWGTVKQRAVLGCGRCSRNILETLRGKISTSCTWMKNCSLPAQFGVRSWRKLSGISGRRLGQLGCLVMQALLAGWACQEEEIKCREPAARACSWRRVVQRGGLNQALPGLAKCSNHLANGLWGRKGYCHHMLTKHLPLCYTGFIIRAWKLNIFYMTNEQFQHFQ